jgi:twitching motility protein PilT
MLDVDLAAMNPDAIDIALEHVRGNGHGNGNGNREYAMPSAELVELLENAVEREASDVHLVPGYPPTFRIHGDLHAASQTALTPEQTRAMVEALVPERSRPLIAESKNLDCSVALVYHGSDRRFRASVYLAQGNWCACLRYIPNAIPSLEWLGFPEDLAERLVSHANGLVVLTGVTGSGKTASLAALVHLLRQDPNKRVLTVEEPIEYIHSPETGGIVTQREVGRDVDSFADGLKHGLRQDPNVILVGEIRDRETAQMALSAAETGHLILATLHTRDAKGALTRLVDIFPQETQDDIRAQLAMSLRSVVCQHLLPSVDEGEKRVLALEVLHVNQQVQVAIRSGKIETIESAIQVGKRDGMVTLDDDLQRLVKAGQISADTARRLAKDPSAITGPSVAWS